MNRAEKRHRQKLARKAAIRDRAPRPDSHGRLTAMVAGGARAADPAGSIQSGMALHRAGRLREAGTVYRRVLAIDPGHGDANHLLGGLAHQRGDLAEAEALISRAIATAPHEPIYHFNLGNVFQGLGRRDDAAASFSRAVALKADYAEAHDNLGLMLAEQGMLEGAVASFGNALALRPDWAETHFRHGNALYKLELMDAAAASYRGAVAIAPGHAEAWCNLGGTLKELGQYEDAGASYRKATALKPDFAEAHGGLATAYQHLGRLDDAIDSCRAALVLDPGSAALHGNLGNVLQRLGHLDDAVTSYSAALAIEPDFAIVWNNLKCTVKALEFGAGEGGGANHFDLGAIDRASGNVTLFEHYLDKFRPHQADDSFKAAMAALPAALNRPVVVDGDAGATADPSPLPDQLVALLHFGRSGTGLLHSLIDGHPEISTLPSVYLRGYFNADIWESLSADGWRALSDRFTDMFDVLFDAGSGKPIPGLMLEKSIYLGVKEGMTAVGENRDESLSVDREAFRAEALRLMEQHREIDPTTFLLIVHAAYEKALETTTHKPTAFYHIHNPDDFAKLNFLRCAPDARLVMMVREPVQSCESWIRTTYADNEYYTVADRIAAMLFAVDQIPFRTQDAVGVRLEDLKARPEDTMAALCAWLGVEESPSLYRMTAQGKKWWGDPSSPDYGSAMSPFDAASVRRPVGEIFSETDQFVLGTLYYPFSVRFGYREPDPAGFKRDLAAVRPLLDGMFDFEAAMAARADTDPELFMRGGAYRLLRASLIDRWSVLDEVGDYPGLLTPLELPG